MRPGPQPADDAVEFTLAALTPGAEYRLTGDGVDVTLVADADGTASMALVVDRPLRLTLQPTTARDGVAP